VAFIATIFRAQSTVSDRVAGNLIADIIPLCAGHGGLGSGPAVGPNPHNRFSTIGAKQDLELYKRHTSTKICLPSRRTTTGKSSKEGPYITKEKTNKAPSLSKYARFASHGTTHLRVCCSQKRRTRAGASPGLNKTCSTRVSQARCRVQIQPSLTCRHGSMVSLMPSISRQ